MTRQRLVLTTPLLEALGLVDRDGLGAVLPSADVADHRALLGRHRRGLKQERGTNRRELVGACM